MNQILNATLHLLDDKHALTVVDYAPDGFAVLRVTPHFTIYFQNLDAVYQFGKDVSAAVVACEVEQTRAGFRAEVEVQP